MANRQGVKNRVEKDNGKLKGAAQFYEVESDISRDNDSDIKSDNRNDSTSDKSNDNECAVTSGSNSDIMSDIDSTMFKPKKQPKYIDLHERRTHYITNENIEFIDGLYSKFNQDKSETVNRALNLYRELLKKNRKNGK